MEILTYNDIDNLSTEAFDIFKETIEKLSKQQDQISIALSGGSSVAAIYKQIKERGSEISPGQWEKVIFCFADERIVPLTSDDSNYKFVKEQFLSQLIDDKLITEEQIAKVNVDEDAPHSSYSKRFEDGIDIALLGVGPDSHTCSLFPNHSSTTQQSTGFILVEDSPKPPALRISLSNTMLANTPYSFAFFIGDGKKEAYSNFLNDDLTEQQVPIKIIKKCHNSVAFTNITL